MDTVQDLDIVSLYQKIHDNPEYLDVPNEMTFVESPLHVAASEGRTGLALEILRLKPSLGKKLNLDGLSSLHLAMSNGHTDTVRRLIKHDPDLIRVPGREGITLLHYAVVKDDVNLLINCLLRCPSSIYDLTVRDETVVHIAVRNRNFRAFMVLKGWLLRTYNKSVFRWRNEDGNTLMHLAALTNQSEVMKSLIRFVNVNEQNLEGNTALDILKPENVKAREILMRAGAKEGSSLVDHGATATSIENYLKSKRSRKDVLIRFGAYLEFGLSGNMQNAILVVVVLIATAAFQTILTPPFGISQIDTNPVFPSIHNATTSTNANATSSTNFQDKAPRIAKIIIILNTIAFGHAIGTCLILTYNVVQMLFFPSLLLFTASFAALAYGTYPGTEAYFLPVAVGSLILLPLLIIIIPWKMVKYKTLFRGKRNYCDYSIDEMKYLMFSNIDIVRKQRRTQTF